METVGLDEGFTTMLLAMEWPLFKFHQFLLANEVLGYNGSVFFANIIVNNSCIMNVLKMKFTS